MKKSISVLLCIALLVLPLGLSASAADGIYETGSKPSWLRTLPLQIKYVIFSMTAGSGFWEDSFIVLHEGKIVYEKYSWGQNAEKAHALNSATKSVVSALAGIAIKEGYIGSVQDKVITYFPEAAIAAGQESKRDMTVEHLLTMTSGLPEDAKDLDAPYLTAADAGLTAFESPQAAKPGEKFMYSATGSQCLASLIARATGRNLYDYAQEKLFGPLGMASVTSWRSAADGSTVGGHGLAMTSRDMLRFGQLYLNDGVWNGTRILPEGWVAQSMPKENAFRGYGYMFWGNPAHNTLGDSYEARGLYGQIICVYPERNLVIARTGRGLFGGTGINYT